MERDGGPTGEARGTSRKTTLLRLWALKRFGAQAPRLRRVIRQQCRNPPKQL